MVIDTFRLNIFDTSLNDFDFHSRSQLYDKAENLALTFSQISHSVWMKLGMLL